MARIQQSIEVGVPAHAAYQQLLHFEDYPRFMQEVDTVQRLDGSHLHWSANMSYQTLEWDAEITEQLPDRCIAWRNTGGPIGEERIDLQPLGPSKSRVMMTVDCDPLQWIPAQNGNAGNAVAERLRTDLERFKSWVETNGAEASTMLHEARSMGAAMRDMQSRGAEGPGWSGGDTTVSAGGQAARTTRSDNSLSKSSADDGTADNGDEARRFEIAEEQNFDEQSDQARRIGRMPDLPASGK